ncbi:NAD(P)-dependent oxidoreductase [Marivirga sp. S37H4]|uniref:dTDP-4-dehydrorhamnose reductase n=1 Tax=Marivirga aurantiaca TaxID=2802615 RepID=A0A934X1G8_9BACT|nr:NAD(P)-dependent oxidoreductase [Marivirga aurantiaca]MBK6266655.1 NAD(P)-dependent oxidoreductase [Marivirga aurantiaca]
MKILITGSNGLLGQKLVQLISSTGNHELIATARGKNRLPESEGYRFVSMDITDQKSVETVISSEKPDVIINTAAMTNVDQCETEREACWKLNVDAVSYLLNAAKANDSFLLHLSTDFIFDGSSGPYKEEDLPNPVSYYGESKLAAEKLLLESDIEWAIVRTVLVYGIAHDMSRSNIILWVKKSLEEGKDIHVVDDQWRTPTLAEDLAKGCFLIAEKKAKGIFNISGKDLMTPYEMAIQTASYFDLNKSLITKTDSSRFTQTAKRPPKTGFVLDKAEEVLGYKPHSFKEGIAILSDQLNRAY